MKQNPETWTKMIFSRQTLDSMYGLQLLVQKLILSDCELDIAYIHHLHYSQIKIKFLWFNFYPNVVTRTRTPQSFRVYL